MTTPAIPNQTMPIEAIPRWLFSWDYLLTDPAGLVATLTRSWWRERATVIIGSESYAIARDGFTAHRVSLRQNGTAIATAQKLSLLSRGYRIDVVGGDELILAPRFLTRTWEVRRGETVIGTIRPHVLWSRRAVIELPDDVPKPVQVFLFGLVSFFWYRRASEVM